MSLELVTAPTVEPVSLQEAKDHLRVDNDVEDALIEALIAAARQHLDGRDGWLGRQLMTATWDLTLNDFPGPDFIRLPLPPIQSITSITYVDTAGASQTFEASKYSLSADKHWRPRVDLAHNESWPSTRNQRDAVTVRFIAGYGVQRDLPAPIRAAMLLMVGNLFENREEINIGNIVNLIPTAAALLTPYRVHF